MVYSTLALLLSVFQVDKIACYKNIYLPSEPCLE